MEVIWKFPFEITDHVTIVMPVRAKILKVEAQRDEPCMWALVDPSHTTRERRFRVIGTGHEIEGPLGEHVGTFQMFGGGLVWHVFNDPQSN